MKLYQPQVQLVKRTHMDAPDEYWLHAVTYCDKTYYRPAGHSPLPKTADDDGVFRIELRIAQDMELPEFYLLTPLAHTIYLGSLPFDGGDGLVEVSLKVLVRGDEKPAGTVTVSTSSADKESKPIYDF